MKRYLITGVLLLFSVVGYGQGSKDLVINEILVNNINNYEDDYGHRVPWVEIRNTGFSNVNIASCYLVLESEGKSTAYRIPKGDPRTLIAPQSYIIFFSEGTQSKGIFHTNFRLDMKPVEDVASLNTPLNMSDSLHTPHRSQVVTLSLLEANGKDTLDQISYDLADIKPDIALGLLGNNEDGYVFTELEATTPYATNDTSDPTPAHEEFRRTDPYGYGMSITAMSVVLVALCCLYLVFRTIGNGMSGFAAKKKAKAEAAAAPVSPVVVASKQGVFSGEDMAAIAVALELYDRQMKDTESTVLTINRVAKAYSPWSSKLYGLTQLPNRK